MAGFVDNVKKAWNYTIGGGYADAIVESDIFPFARFEELAAMPDASMTAEDRAEFEKLRPQIEKSAEGISGMAGVVTERAVEATANSTSEILSGAERGLQTSIKEKTTFGKILSWVSENWQLALAGVLGVVGMFSNGIKGAVATIGAVLLAGNGLSEKMTGKNLVEMGGDVVEKIVPVKQGEVADLKAAQRPSMDELVAKSGINYKNNHASKLDPKSHDGFVEGLVNGAKAMDNNIERTV